MTKQKHNKFNLPIQVMKWEGGKGVMITFKSFPNEENSGMDDNSLSYASSTEAGFEAGSPNPVGFFPATFFSVSGCAFTSLGTESMSNGSSDGSCIRI